MSTQKCHSYGKRDPRAVIGAVALALGGCALEPQGPTPISRLPADQSGIAATAQPLTPEARAHYEAINRQVLAD
jgi:hypothetical protein